MYIVSFAQQQSDVAANGKSGSPVGSPVANIAARLGSFTFRRTSSGRVETTADSESDETASVGGSFFETLTSSEFYKNTKVLSVFTTFRRVISTCNEDQSLPCYASTGWRYLRKLPLGTISCATDV